jgi:hypothetical protein
MKMQAKKNLLEVADREFDVEGYGTKRDLFQHTRFSILRDPRCKP